jgi:hypothetical protein
VSLLAGLILALAAVLLVLEPVIRTAAPSGSAPEPVRDPALERRDLALAALKEIEFDRATGKLSDADYQVLRERYTAEAVEALRAADRVLQSATADGTAIETVERLIAETRLGFKGRKYCTECGAVLEGSGRFCVECGAATNQTVGA